MSKIEELINKEGFYIGKVKGDSMLPLLDESNTLVKVVKIKSELKVNDMVMYHLNDKTILHRIIGADGDNYLISGDNTNYVSMVNRNDIIGIVESYIKDGKEIKLSNQEYLDYLTSLESDVSKRELIYKKTGINKSYLDFISLIRDTIFDKDDTSIKLNYKDIFNLAKRQKVGSFIFNKIDKNACDEEVYKNFNNLYNFNLKRKILFDNEKKEILSLFEKEGIKYLPIKGDDLNSLYPKNTIREFSDFDIVVSDEKKVEKIMTERGYTSNPNLIDHRYYKEPYFFEMHNYLFDEDEDKNHFFDDIFSLATKDEDNDYGYHLEGELYYVYLINHMHKHYSSYGFGIRFFIDLYYFLLNNKLDDSLVETLLNKLEIKEFHDEWITFMKDLLFGDLNKLDDKKVNYILSGSVYGKASNRVENEVAEKGKAGYIFNRLIPPYSYMTKAYPWLIKRPYLYPYSLVKRVFDIWFNKNRRNKFKGEAKALKNMNNK